MGQEIQKMATKRRRKILRYQVFFSKGQEKRQNTTKKIQKSDKKGAKKWEPKKLDTKIHTNTNRQDKL